MRFDFMIMICIGRTTSIFFDIVYTGLKLIILMGWHCQQQLIHIESAKVKMSIVYDLGLA